MKVYVKQLVIVSIASVSLWGASFCAQVQAPASATLTKYLARSAAYNQLLKSKNEKLEIENRDLKVDLDIAQEDLKDLKREQGMQNSAAPQQEARGAWQQLQSWYYGK